MGRPSKHRLQTTAASLRQRAVDIKGIDTHGVEMQGVDTQGVDIKGVDTRGVKQQMRLSEGDNDSTHNGWSTLPADRQHGADMKPPLAARLSPGNENGGWSCRADDGTLMMLMTDSSRLMLRPQRQRQRRLFGSDAVNSVVSADPSPTSRYSGTVAPPSVGLSSCGPPTGAGAGAGAGLSVVKMECQTADEYVAPVAGSSIAASSPSMSYSADNKQFTVSWQAGSAGAWHQASSAAGAWQAGSASKPTCQHVLSGGYCSEASVTSTATTDVSKPQLTMMYTFTTTATTMTMHGKTLSHGLSLSAVSAAADSRLMSTTHSAATAAAASDDGGDDTEALALSVSVSTVAADTVAVHTPDSDVASSTGAAPLCSSVSPSGCSKWHHIASDRDSPYVSVMALASSCHLFSESCPTATNDEDDTALVYYNQASSRYWLEPELPDENVIFTEKHCEMINQITAAYDRYVQTGTIINETLVTEMKVFICTLCTPLALVQRTLTRGLVALPSKHSSLKYSLLCVCGLYSSRV